jgi:hypothetical protein
MAISAPVQATQVSVAAEAPAGGGLLVAEGASIEVVEPPLEDRLRPGTRLHRKVLERLQSRRDYSRNKISQRYDAWDVTRQHTGLYLDLHRAATLGDGSEDPEQVEMPNKRSLRIPMSLSIQLTILSQWLGMYMMKEPPFQLRGRGPEDVRRAPLMEAMLAYDMEQTGLYKVLYSLFQDALSFGYGVLHDTWSVEMGDVTRYIPLSIPGVPQPIIDMLLGDQARYPIQEWGILSEGNRWRTIDPYSVYPDPRVPASELQRGEFFMHRFTPNVLALRSMPEVYFNLDELDRWDLEDPDSDKGPTLIDQTVDPYTDTDTERSSTKKSGFLTCISAHVRLIPRDWGLEQGSRPELWQFTFTENTSAKGGAGGVIIRAHRCRNPHNQFPYGVAESLPDFHGVFSPGLIESGASLQRFIDWAFNARYSSVMSTLNPRWLYASQLINRTDLEHGGIGDGVRLTSDGEDALLSGHISSIGAMLQQMPMSDVTGSHDQLWQQLYAQAQTMMGSNDPTMGKSSGSDTTATEISTLAASSGKRIVMLGRLTETTTIGPAVRRGIANRQHWTQSEQYYRILGDAARQLPNPFMLLKVNDIQGNFDFIATDGTGPDDPARQAMVFQQLMNTAGQAGLHLQPGPDGRVVDLRGLLRTAAEQMGVRNWEQYLVEAPQPQQPMGPPGVMPDEQLQQQVQAGNMVPV